MRKTIVLVDDSETSREWARSQLEPHGFAVVGHGGSFGVQTFVGKVQPDLVLMDVNLPAGKGTLVCKLLKEYKRTSAIPVVLYSSMSTEELSNAVEQCGADGYIVKTNELTKLLSQLVALFTKLGEPR